MATFPEVLHDLRGLQNKLRNKAGIHPALEEIKNNVYPIIEALLEATAEDLAKLDGAVKELVAQTQSLIQPELADSFDDFFDMGDELCAAVEKVPGLPPDVAELVVNFRKASEEARASVDEFAVDYEDEEGEGEEGEEESEEEESPPAAAATEEVA